MSKLPLTPKIILLTLIGYENPQEQKFPMNSVIVADEFSLQCKIQYILEK